MSIRSRVNKEVGGGKEVFNLTHIKVSDIGHLYLNLIIERDGDACIDEVTENSHATNIPQKKRGKLLSKLVADKLEQPPPTPTPENRQRLCSVEIKNVVDPYTAIVYNETGGPLVPNFPDFFTTLRNDELSRIPLPSELKCSCSCQDGCNPYTCPCYLANVQMSNGRGTFSTLDSKSGRVNLKNGTPFYSDKFIVACGRSCACHPDHPQNNKEGQKCNRNVDNLKIDTKFEVFCHPVKGYCLRTLKNIKGLQIIGELTGHVKKSKGVSEEEDSSHAMNLYFREESSGFINQLRSMEKFKDIKDLEKIIGNDTYYVQAFKKSSFMRLCAHSCLPNAGFVKVVANNFHPSSRRLFYVAFHPIEENEEVTISYGSFYVKHLLNGCCCCGTSICLNKKSRFTEAADLITMERTKNYLMSFIRKAKKGAGKTQNSSENMKNGSTQSRSNSKNESRNVINVQKTNQPAISTIITRSKTLTEKKIPIVKKNTPIKKATPKSAK